jgi:adenylate cyclase
VLELQGVVQDATDVERGLAQDFATALREFKERGFAGARTGFVQCLERLPQDGPSRYYLALCDHYLARPPAPAWDGVVSVADHQALII